MLASMKHHCTWASFSRSQLINKIKPFIQIGQQMLHFCDESTNRSNQNNPTTHKDPKEDPIVSANVETKYDVFTNDSTTIILDIEEEREKIFNQVEPEMNKDGKWRIPAHISQERGKTGVFDIDQLVALLKRDNAQDMFVCSIPAKLKYVDYFCVVSGKSYRHMEAMAEFVRKMYKVKRNPKDPLPKIEGKNSGEWIAMDLGNIALHIFSADTRNKYDIEQLWSVGSDYDELTKRQNLKEDSILDLFNQHSIAESSFYQKNENK